MAERRRLPVLQSEDEEGTPRPAWQWVGIGAVAILMAWLLLAMAANPLASRLGGHVEPNAPAPVRLVVALVVGNALALALAAFGGGYLVGRFGGLAGAREAGYAGLAAAAVGFALAVGDPTRSAQGGVFGWALLLVVVVALAGGFALLGGRRGVRARVRISP